MVIWIEMVVKWGPFCEALQKVLVLGQPRGERWLGSCQLAIGFGAGENRLLSSKAQIDQQYSNLLVWSPRTSWLVHALSD